MLCPSIASGEEVVPAMARYVILYSQEQARLMLCFFETLGSLVAYDSNAVPCGRSHAISFSPRRPYMSGTWQAGVLLHLEHLGRNGSGLWLD